MIASSVSIEELRARVTLDAVRAARNVIEPHLPRTPLTRHALLVSALGLEVYVKHENHLPTGSFKVRGGLNYVATLDAQRRARGIVSATRGNHGQSLALAAEKFAVRCVVVVPHGNNPEKNAAMQAFGAELIEHGSDFDEATLFARALAEREGLTMVSSAEEPALINGVGTYHLEILEDLPDLDAVIVPVGAGSGICGAATVYRALKPEVRIIGVQAERAPSVHDSWLEGKPRPTRKADTFADGIATREPYPLPLEIMREGVDRMVLVSEEEMRRAIALLLATTHNLAEGAGAASTAAAIKLKEELIGRKVVLVLSGGNLDLKTLRWVLGSETEPRA